MEGKQKITVLGVNGDCLIIWGECHRTSTCSFIHPCVVEQLDVSQMVRARPCGRRFMSVGQFDNFPVYGVVSMMVDFHGVISQQDFVLAEIDLIVLGGDLVTC